MEVENESAVQEHVVQGGERPLSTLPWDPLSIMTIIITAFVVAMIALDTETIVDLPEDILREMIESTVGNIMIGTQSRS